MRIVVANLKGGVGKTTSAVYLAAVGVERFGEGVVLADGDQQGSAAEWLEAQPVPGVVLVEAPSARLVARTLGPPGGGLVIADTPPQMPLIVTAALEAADAVVIPTRSGGVEPARVSATLSLVPEGVPVGLVVCAGRARTKNLAETVEAWGEVGVEVWGVIPERTGIESGPAGEGLHRTGLIAYAGVLDRAVRAMEVRV